ncbi:MAG: TonB-dependent receptor [Thermococci archaeon]|nr:TonB-dependent receptor [Thermococci archaeon]
MGHTIYYKTAVDGWKEFMSFVERVCYGLGYSVEEDEDALIVIPECPLVEPLIIERNGSGFVKTNLIEPCHSIYLLLLHSISSFGSVSVFED